jgi:hypothetical protein
LGQFRLSKQKEKKRIRFESAEAGELQRSWKVRGVLCEPLRASVSSVFKAFPRPCRNTD